MLSTVSSPETSVQLVEGCFFVNCSLSIALNAKTLQLEWKQIHELETCGVLDNVKDEEKRLKFRPLPFTMLGTKHIQIDQ